MRGGIRFRVSYPLVIQVHIYARVVELADSLDSGSSVLYGRAGSSPASRTKKETGFACLFFGAPSSAYNKEQPSAAGLGLV